ncbi:hypothetical protein H1R20_g2788, partial [Candolleomyces eurysporus]
MLKKITSLVKPIMRNHGWVLPELSEFFPDNPNLLGLNVNGGQKIMLRLRPHHSPTWFFELDEVVQTMLHELTHNVHGPHDDKFYKFLSELQKEYDDLQRSGYAGEGFHSPGQRLGGRSHNLPPHLARQKALEAAEKRNQVTRVLGGGAGGHRLGGTTKPSTRPMTPGEMAAQAAERRLRDSKTCGSQQGSDYVQRESEKASREGIKNEVIDLTMPDDSELWEPDWISDPESDEIIILEDVQPAPPKAGPSRLTTTNTQTTRAAEPKRPVMTKKPPNRVNMAKPTTSASTSASAASSSSSAPYSKLSRPQRAAQKSAAKEWACEACTLVNQPFALQCDACGMRRPPDKATGWACLACGKTGMPHEFWTCTLCGTVKAQS